MIHLGSILQSPIFVVVTTIAACAGGARGGVWLLVCYPSTDWPMPPVPAEAFIQVEAMRSIARLNRIAYLHLSLGLAVAMTRPALQL